MSTTDKRFPLFHSVDRSIGKMSGISFQFLPELESEARLMISNLLPYLHYHYGDISKQCFTPSAVERLDDCQWDPTTGTITGAYDDEINFLDDSDLMAQYISSKNTNVTHTHSEPSTPTKSNADTILNPTKLHSTAYGNDDDSVSTLGHNTTRKWSPHTPSPQPSPFSIPKTISRTEKTPTTDDHSIGSVSTLNTRINSIEGQFQELSGTMEHIKNMLNMLTNSNTNQDGDPRSSTSASQGDLAGASS